jgi:Asp-tRNA(Asn)/Glu-tRNA(Gln) amidotransferase B subunit
MASLMKGRTGDWEIVIGLEVHAQVTADAKLFSGASTAFGADPNTQVSLVDAAMPGMLPVVNEKSIEQAVRTGLALNAEVRLHSVFARKNYFYPDLPQGYQISQYEEPIIGEGEIVIDLPDGDSKTVGIERLHLEQDAGKSVHDLHPSQSYIDLNRSGVTLMEIVSSVAVLYRSEPLWRDLDGNRVQARYALRRRSCCLYREDPIDPALHRVLRRQHAGRLDAGGRERVGAPAGRRPGNAL